MSPNPDPLPQSGQDSLFQDAIARVLTDEGGFQKNPHDAGNWTGGAVGQGELKGTNFGISAATYPGVDIEHLTRDQAVEIYYRDWWCRYRFFAQLPHDDAVKLFDLAVNMGTHRAELLLQEAVNRCGVYVEVDGQVGPLTLAAVHQCNAQALLAGIKLSAEAFHESLAANDPDKARFLDGWLRRDAE